MYYLDAMNDFYRKYIGVLSFLGLVPGVLLLFWYCVRIGFYPAGIGVGDVLFFIFIVLIFGFSYFILLMLILQVSFLLVLLYGRFLRVIKRLGVGWKLNARARLVGRWDGWMAFNGAVSLCFFLLYAVISGEYLGVIGLIVISSLLLWFYVGARRGQVYSVFLWVILPVIFLNNSIGYLVDNTFSMIGFRNESVSVAIDISDLGGSDLLVENNFDCNDICILKNVDVEFIGVGSFTKLRVNVSGKSISVVMPAESIKYIVTE